LVAPITELGETALSVESAKDVVEASLHHLMLHQRHVFVGGGVEDHGGPVGVEDGGQRTRVAHVPDIGNHSGDAGYLVGRVGKGGCEDGAHLDADLMDGVLATPEQHHQLGAGPQALAHDLGSDGAARPGHQHSLPPQVIADFDGVQANRLALEQIFELQGAQSGHLQLSFEQLRDRRQSAQLQLESAHFGHDFAVLGWSQACQHQSVDGPVGHQVVDVV
jgi:hypothetical protein